MQHIEWLAKQRKTKQMNYSIPTQKEVEAYNHGTLVFNTIDEAITKAEKISKDLLYSVSILYRNSTKKFHIIKLYSNTQKCHDQFKKLVTNYEANFTISSYSPKSGEHIDSFATIERAEGYRKQMVADNFRKKIIKFY